MERQLKKIWVCNDILMDIFPYFDRAQLGLNLALLSPRFDGLVDKHFDRKELTIWRTIRIHKELAGPNATLSVRIDGNYVEFPWPDRPLPNKIRFRFLRIAYIDYAVVEFLRSNQQIFDRNRINLYLMLSTCNAESNVQRIWDVFVRQIWPIFTTTNVHHLSFKNDAHFDTLLRLTSPSILSDVNLSSMHFYALFPDALGDEFDGPNATPTAGQALSKWLHTSSKDGQPKRLHCVNPPKNLEWITNVKEKFLRATTSVSYKVNFELKITTPIEPFVLVNGRTKEKLTLEQVTNHPAKFLLKRCPINGETAAVKWENENSDANLNKVYFVLYDNNWIGPLSPPAEEKNEKADQAWKISSNCAEVN